MSEEEIKALAFELGLDPKRLVIREPFWHDYGFGNFKHFKWTYKDKLQHDHTFVLDDSDITIGEARAVRFYVNKGLRELAKAVNFQMVA